MSTLIDAQCVIAFTILIIFSVTSAELYEGEIFFLTFPVHLDIDEDYIMNELTKIEAHLTLELLNGEQQAGKQAICNRIALVRSFIYGFLNIRKLEYDSLELANTIFNRVMSLLYAAMETFPPETAGLYRVCQNSPPSKKLMFNLQGLGASSKTPYQIPLPMGFFPSLSQKYGFPDVPFFQNRRNSFSILSQLTLSIIHALELRNVVPYQQAVDYFFYYYQRDYTLITRSIIHLIYPGSRKSQMVQILKESIISFVNPPELRTSQINDNIYVNKFLKDCVGTFCDFLKTFQLKGKVRRRKLNEVIEKFQPLLTQAEELDLYLSSPNGSKYCHTWLMFYMLKAMNLYVMSGFGNVYSDRDYYYIYWYLDNFVYDWILRVLKTARAYKTANDRLFPIPDWVNHYEFTEQVFTLSIIFACALKCLCGAYFKCLLGFRIEYRLFNPLVDNEEEFFAHYLEPLLKIRYPPGPSYEYFKNNRDIYEQQLSLKLYSESIYQFNRAIPLFDACVEHSINIGDYYKIIQDNKFKIGQIMKDPHYQRKVRLIDQHHPLFVAFKIV